MRKWTLTAVEIRIRGEPLASRTTLKKTGGP
jgi:hypothetical protein